jgi:predicted transcriptional regulator
MHANYFIIADEENKYAGLLSSATLFNSLYSEDTEVSDLIKRKDIFAHPDDSLKSVVEMMVNENVDLLPIIANNEIIGVLSHTQILSVLKNGIDEDLKRTTHISLNRQRLKILVRGQKLMSFINRKRK